MRRPRGLTLVELLIVVFLFGLLAAWGLPQWGRAQQRQQVSVTANEARDLLGLIRSLATHDPHPPDDPPSPPESEPRYEYRLEVVSTEGQPTRLRLVRQIMLVDLTTSPESATPREDPEILRELTVPAGVTATVQPSAALSFDRYGRALADSTLLLEGSGKSHVLRIRAGQPEIILE